MIFKRLRRSVILLRSCCFLNSGYSQRVLLSSTFASRGVLTAQPRRLRASFKMAPPLSTLLRVRMLNMHPLTFLLPTTSRNQHPCEPSKDISQSSVGLNVARSYLLGPKGNSRSQKYVEIAQSVANAIFCRYFTTGHSLCFGWYHVAVYTEANKGIPQNRTRRTESSMCSQCFVLRPVGGRTSGLQPVSFEELLHYRLPAGCKKQKVQAGVNLQKLDPTTSAQSSSSGTSRFSPSSC